MNPNSIENEMIRLMRLGGKPSGYTGKRRKRQPDRYYQFAIYDKTSGQTAPLGMISLKITDAERREALLERSEWSNACLDGSVMGEEAVRLLCKLAFDVLRIEEIAVYGNSNDAGFLRLCKSCGFTATGLVRQSLGNALFEMRRCSG